MFSKPLVVVSKCLEHEPCRFDGSMISSPVVKDLMPYVEFLPLCPEMDIGLPTPRESLRLIDIDGDKRLLMSKSGEDKTDDMLNYVQEVATTLRDLEPDGFILKNRSPSCGIKDVKLYKKLGKAPCINKSSRGTFGQGIMIEFEDSSFEDEGRLTNFDIREHFYTAIFTRAEFKDLAENVTVKKIIDFHSKHKYLFMAYSQNQLKILGRIVANHEGLDVVSLYKLYKEQLSKLFSKKPSKGHYINVMLHIFGYYSKSLNNEEKAYFLDTLEQYRSGQVPQMSVLSLLRSWAFRFDESYLRDQSIFEPFPKELVQARDSGKVVL